jgi:hypothetical protein
MGGHLTGDTLYDYSGSAGNGDPPTDVQQQPLLDAAGSQQWCKAGSNVYSSGETLVVIYLSMEMMMEMS